MSPAQPGRTTILCYARPPHPTTPIHASTFIVGSKYLRILGLKTEPHLGFSPLQASKFHTDILEHQHQDHISYELNIKGRVS